MSASLHTLRRLPLAQQVADIRRTMDASVSGPLVVANKLTSIVDDWENYREEAGGLDATAWGTKTFGSPGFLLAARNRAEAVEKLTAMGWRDFVLSRMHHEVAVYVAGAALSDADRKRVLPQLKFETVSRGNILTPNQATRLIARVLGKVARPRGTDITKALLASLREHREAMTAAGLELPALPDGIEF